MSSTNEKSTTPSVSVIMPVRNEADYIEECLRSVLTQDYPNILEVIIADGMSEDATRAIIEQMSSESVIPVRIYDNPGRITPKALNVATAQTSGEIIVRVDGHCVLEPDYVSQCVHALRQEGADGAGGSIETVSATALGNSIALAMSSVFGVGNSSFRTLKGQKRWVDTIPFPAYERTVVEAVGPYDEELMRNQDDEYNYRLRKHGFRLLLSPHIKSRYYSRTSLKKLWRQFHLYGLYKVRVMQKHPQQMSLRQFVPFVFVTTLGISLLLATVLEPFLWLLLAVLSLYLFVNLTVSILLSAQNGWGNLVYLPLIFGIIHIAYGSGSWRGLYRFRSRWGDKGSVVPTQHKL